MMTPYKKRKEAIFPGPAPGGALATVASSGVFFGGRSSEVRADCDSTQVPPASWNLYILIAAALI